jgi:hypothetical protein
MPIFGYVASVALFVLFAFGQWNIRTTGKISCDDNRGDDIFPVFYFTYLPITA